MASSAFAPRQADKLIGEVLANRYLIEERLGEGAMGSVYKARHVKVGRAFAVKVLHAELLEDDKLAQRFAREAELAGRLRHPNVIGVVDVGETNDGLRYMVMDFAEGENLADLLSEAPMPAPRIINLTRQLLEGLYHAHEAGLIHRDFKPENVIVERDAHGTEVPRIVDFGIAILSEGGESPRAEGRLTTNGLVLGTPHYMAPEQAVADPLDHRIDLFALGIVVYEMLCGKLPFDGSGADIARANLLREPPPISQRVPYLEVDPLLEAFSRRLMAKRREHRPATAKAARELLDLIERDREAAAAELGVYMPPATRFPAETAPVSPMRVDEDAPPVTEEPVPVMTAPAPVAVTATPVVDTTALPTATLRVGTERPVESAHATPEPTPEPKPDAPRRRTGLLIGIGLAAASGIVGLVLATQSGNDDKGSQDDAKAPAVSSTPAATDADAPATGERTPDTAVVLAPDTNTPDTTEPNTEPDTTEPDTGTEPDTTASDTELDVEIEMDPPDTNTPDTGTSVRRPQPTDRRTPPDRTRVNRTKVTPGGAGNATSEETTPANAANVARKYQEIGSKLKQMSSVDDLWSRYRLIRISDAMRDPTKLEETSNMLLQLEREIAARTKAR